MSDQVKATTPTTALNGSKPASANESADVTVTDSVTVKGNWPPGLTDTIRDIANREAQAIVNEREARENKRANHRNLNRMLTLFGALVIGLIVTYGLEHGGFPMFGVTLPPSTKLLAPYAFVITIAMDSTLALYSFIRHY